MTYLCLIEFKQQLVKPRNVSLAADLAVAASASLAALGSHILAKPLRRIAKMCMGQRTANMESNAQLFELQTINCSMAS
jgi:hypothetical protein